HFLVREHVVRDVVQVDRGLAEDELRRAFRNVGARDHGFDAGYRFSVARIDGHDTRVRVRAAEDRAVQHARQTDVGAVVGTAGHLVDAVVADGPCAHVLVYPVAHTVTAL